jgi:glucan phosphoethanolaminetransferase (alkaline phosphatase superfamily)
MAHEMASARVNHTVIEPASYTRGAGTGAGKFLAGLALEASLYVLPAAAFLAYYAHGPRSASIAPHLSVVLALVAALLALRLLFARHPAGKWVAAGAAVAAVLVQWAAYAFFTLGMAYWGRIPNVQMLQTYMGSGWHLFLGVLGIPTWLPWLALFMAAAVATGLVACVHRAAGWPTVLAGRLRAPVRWVVLLGACALLSLRIHAATSGGFVGTGEPLSLALTANKPGMFTYTPDDRLLANDGREKALAANYRPSPLRPKRNVIVIVSDALRADRMSLLGYSRPTTPRLDQACKDAAQCEAQRAVAACSESFCGLMSLVRGKPYHGSSRHSLLLSDVLRAHGYKHHLLLSGDHTTFYGLDKSFGHADTFWDGTHAKGYANDDQHLLQRAEQLPQASMQPAYLHFHLMSTHALGLRHVSEFKPAVNYHGKKPGDHPSAAAAFNNFYDNGVQQFDAVTAKLLATLRAKGYLDDAMVLITADHGEMLGEHGRLSHSFVVYQPLLDIPFVMLRYGHSSPPWPDRPRAQYDLAPTLVSELGLPVPEGWTGIPAGSAKGHQFIEFEQFEFTGLLDVRDPKRLQKFWVEAGTGKTFFADLKQDPRELHASVSKPSAQDQAMYMNKLNPYVNRIEALLRQTSSTPSTHPSAQGAAVPQVAHRQ